MNIADFDIYQALLKQNSGLVLTQDKSYLVDSRLNPIAKKWGYENIDAMTTILRGMPPKELITDIVEAMTTNETSFFRDTKPFEIFKNTVLPYFKNKPDGQKKLRIWCAAASSGQEPYSLAITLQEEQKNMPGWSYEILATDISYEILEQAREGVYTQFEVQRGLPITHLMKYFTQTETKWAINKELKDMIQYDFFNLLDPMKELGQFDIIFCRNVLIYFDPPTKKEVLEKMHAQLADDGFLFLGGAETVIGITDSFGTVPDNRGLYGKTDGIHIKKP